LPLAICLVIALGLGGWTGFHAIRHAWARTYRRAAYHALTDQDFARAAADLKTCLTYWPDDPELHFLTARTLRRAALVGSADPDWEEQALGHLTACERLSYPPEDVALEKTLLRAMRGDLEAVETHLVTLLAQKHPDTPFILETLVPLYLARFQVPRALLCTAQLLGEEPDHPWAYTWRGMVRDLLLSNGQAADDYRHALDLKPDLDEARRRLAEDLLLAQQYDAARTHLERLLQHQPDNPEVMLGLARALHGQGQMAAASELLDRLLTTEPANGLALQERGKIALELGRLDEAEALLRRALERVPDQPQLNYALFQCLLQKGRREEAARYRARYEKLDADGQRFRKVAEQLRRSPQSTDLRAEAGALLVRHDQTAQGLGWLASALQLDPSHPLAHLALAEHYARQGQPDAAAYHQRLAVLGYTRRLAARALPIL
jgi:predicted Zn-dependent protease